MSSTFDTPQSYASEVREHYEELPYPYRDPEKEGAACYGNDGFSIDALSHMQWGGTRDLRQGGRILIAGDGTGDAAVQFAEALAGSNAQIVAIDLSAKSIEVSKARLAKRKLANVTHHHMSLLDLPQSGLGPFDAIECCGVLHHLPDPAAGLAALNAVLAEDGIMTIMVYAQYGRTAIYMVQDMLRRLLKPGMSRAEKIAVARAFLDYVPNSHLLTVKNEGFLEDIRWPDGSGIYDLFLHSTDRAYTVPQLYAWVEAVGLKISSFFSDFTDDSLYLPEYYTAAAAIRGLLEEKTLPEKYAIGELMHGTMIKHHFYASRNAQPQPTLSDKMVIGYGFMQSMFTGYVLPLLETLAKAPLGERVAVASSPIASAPQLFITKRPATELLLRHLDGRRSVGDMVAQVARISKQSRNEVRKDLAVLYKELRARNMVFLRHQSIPPYISGVQMIERFKQVVG